MPGKRPDTTIKSLPLANGHGRYMALTAERTLVSVGVWPLHTTVKKFVTVSPPKRLRNGRFASENTVQWFQKRNGHLDPGVA
jgi:hypothetical protein